jgi:hypothetical protein
MNRIEEAINIVHLLADQPPIDNDRRRVFPLVVRFVDMFVRHDHLFSSVSLLFMCD